jgi:geranylgeranyl pyrophosphate synthase
MNTPDYIPGTGVPSFQRIEVPLGQVRDYIHQSLGGNSVHQELAAFLTHLRAGSGKMLRPGLVLLAGECFGALKPGHIQVSALMEMIHQATLLHDDVIDEAHKRRGLPTANRLWGNESAVLLGDYVLSQVFRLTAELDAPIARVLAQTAVRVCEGELRQTLQKRNWQLSESRYIEIITEKSAAFFGGCCRLGAMLSQADAPSVEALARFGLLAGIAFQIADDLLDIAGDEARTGKTAQSDFAGDKPTLAVIHLLRTAEAQHQARARALLETPAESNRALVEMLERHGSLRYARAQGADYVARAAQALDPVPPSPAKEALLETARFMADRMV